MTELNDFSLDAKIVNSQLTNSFFCCWWVGVYIYEHSQNESLWWSICFPFFFVAVHCHSLATKTDLWFWFEWNTDWLHLTSLYVSNGIQSFEIYSLHIVHSLACSFPIFWIFFYLLYYFLFKIRFVFCSVFGHYCFELHDSLWYIFVWAIILNIT